MREKAAHPGCWHWAAGTRRHFRCGCHEAACCRRRSTSAIDSGQPGVTTRPSNADTRAASSTFTSQTLSAALRQPLATARLSGPARRRGRCCSEIRRTVRSDQNS